MGLKGKGNVQSAALTGAGLLCGGLAYLAANAVNRRQFFVGKVVLITGSSRGLGLALAEEIGRRGARLVLTARDAEELDRARARLLQVGAVRDEADIFTVLADLRNAEAANRVIETATRRYGRVDVLINNAGVITVGPLENQTAANFRDVMDTNFFSAVHCTLSVLPQMMERGEGSIANITSIGGKVAVPHLLPYTASKFAEVGFSEGLAIEARSKGIRVTTVCPGLMRTGSHLNAIFTGDAPREYQWFSMAANLPGFSTSACTAARKIADGIASGTAEVTISPDAFIAARFGNLSPLVTRLAMGVMHSFLPPATSENSGLHRGADVRTRELYPAATLGADAAERYNETGGAEDADKGFK